VREINRWPNDFSVTASPGPRTKFRSSKAMTRSEESIQTRAKQDGLKVSKLR
jgi:hypothetical protein